MKTNLVALVATLGLLFMATPAYADYPDDCLGNAEPSSADCGDINDIGCCDALGRVVYCMEGALYCIDCAGGGPECGWDAGDGWYDCGTDGSPDPSGDNPMNCESCDPACGEGYICQGGECVECNPDCEGKMCGSDGCGGNCGECLGQCLDGICHAGPGCEVGEGPGCGGCPCEACVCDLDPYCCDTQWDGQCVGECIGECGGCPALENCGDDECVSAEFENCATCPEDCPCGDGEVCYSGECCIPVCEVGSDCQSDGCGGMCPCTEDGGVCFNEACCQPACEGKACGADACGGTCGECAEDEGCINFVCGIPVGPGCEPSDVPGCGGCECEECVCAMDDYCCSTAWDGLCIMECVECGSCALPLESCGDATCDPAVFENCASCDADCACGEGEVCADGFCCATDCDGKECGIDGCGGVCGECLPGDFCNDGFLCEPLPTCEVMEAIACDETKEGDTTGHENLLEEYSCAGWDESGPEIGYSFTSDIDDTVTVTIEYDAELTDLDILGVAQTCTIQDCVAYGNLEIAFDVTAGTPYFFVVDGFGGAEGAYSISVKCLSTCVADCDGKDCGDDGCGGTCGECGAGFACQDFECVESTGPGECLGPNEPSAPDCGDVNDIGCCDDLGRVLYCQEGALYCIDCPAVEAPVCGWVPDNNWYDCGSAGEEDPSGANPLACAGGCDPACGPDESCIDGECVACEPDCTGAICGDDGCGGSCGTCSTGTCFDGACHGGPGCEPNSEGEPGCGGCPCEACVCELDEYCCTDSYDEICVQLCIEQCGGCPLEITEDCGNDSCDAGEDCASCPADCGCAVGENCVDGLCVDDCTPECGEKVCGDDGCNGSCGNCAAGEECNAGVCEPGGETPDTDVTQDTGGEGEGEGEEPKAKKSGCNTNGTGNPLAAFLFLALMLGIVSVRRYGFKA